MSKLSDMQAFLKPGERLDDLQLKDLFIIQDPRAFCFGIDAVLLSNFVQIQPGEKAADLCTGNGILPLLLSAKTECAHITGLEIQPGAFELAVRNLEMNGLGDRITIIKGDVKEASAILGKASMEVVVSNPPYIPAQRGLLNPDSPKALARHELEMDFEDLARESAALLKEGGRFYLVHRPQRLVEIFVTLRKYKLEPKRMQMVHPFLLHEANLVLLEAKKGGGQQLITMEPLIIEGAKEGEK